MTVGGDPEELRRLAAGGPGQGFALDHRARVLGPLAARHRRRNPASVVDAAPAAAGLRSLSRRIVRLDTWVLAVADALHAADATSFHARLLGLGPAILMAVGDGPQRADPTNPTNPAGPTNPTDASALPVARLSSAALDEVAAWPGLPGPWRDLVHRERMRRWLGRVDERVAAVPHDPGRGVLDRFARWVDTVLVDRVSLVTDLHVTRAERIARLRSEADGVRRLLSHPTLTVWSFTPSSATPTGGPAARVALGDPATADVLAVLLPGTSTGLHAVDDPLADAAALHAAATSLGDGEVATVLDLYDAPSDLGRAADTRPARAAAAATAAFLTDLPAAPRRTTLVGHSYGAYTAARTSHHRAPVDALVLLGAPGVGVVHRDQLHTPEVWAARAPQDPIAAVADLDEFVAALPPRLRPRSGPLLDPLVALGPDPTDAEFGARRLPTSGAGGVPVRGHVDYLRPDSASLTQVARVVVGRPRSRSQSRPRPRPR